MADNQRMFETLTDFKDYLTTGDAFKTKVASVASDYSVTMPSIGGTYWHFLDTYYDKSYQYPSIEIVPVRRTKESKYYQTPSIDEKLFYIDVLISHKAGDPKTVQNVVMVFAEALSELLEDDQTCGSRFLQAVDTEIDYTAIMEDQKDGQMLQILPITIMIKRAIH